METLGPKIEAALQHWQQGDCALGDFWFPFGLNPESPITDAAKAAASSGINLAEERVRGLVIVSQTCDIVRDYIERPFIQVVPLVEISDPIKFAVVSRGQYPRYAVVPSLADQKLVADLERCTTLEKPVVLKWNQIKGCRTSSESRVFAWALARQKSRFAFPDDFAEIVGKLISRFKEKHDKSSPEGRALRALQDVRVTPTPDWHAATVGLYYWFIRDEEISDLEGKSWAEHLQSWEPLIEASGRYHNIGSAVVTLRDLTAHDYLNSDSIDLEHLSMSKK